MLEADQVVTAIRRILAGEVFVSDSMAASILKKVAGGTTTLDPSVQRFPLARVLEETKALLDGSSPVTKRRLQMMEKAEGVLPI